MRASTCCKKITTRISAITISSFGTDRSIIVNVHMAHALNFLACRKADGFELISYRNYGDDVIKSREPGRFKMEGNINKVNAPGS